MATGGTEQEFRDMAVFGELTLNITDRWQVTGGVRIFDQELDGTSGIPLPFASRTIEFFYYGSATDDFLLGGINPTENEVSDEIFKVNTSYEVTDDMLAFFTWSQGFRAGGANQLPEIDPLETITPIFSVSNQMMPKILKSASRAPGMRGSIIRLRHFGWIGRIFRQHYPRFLESPTWIT